MRTKLVLFKPRKVTGSRTYDNAAGPATHRRAQLSCARGSRTHHSPNATVVGPIFLSLLLAPSLPAQQPPDTATLVVFNHRVITFRGGLGANTARERAEAALRRLELLPPDLEPEARAQPSAQGLVITVSGRPVFTVLPADVDTLGGETLASAAGQAASRLQAAIEAGREQRSWMGVARAALAAFLATIVFLFGLRLLRVGRRQITKRLLVIGRASIPAISVAGVKLLERQRILGFLLRAAEFFFWGAGLFLAYLWLTFVLTQFPYTRPWGEALGHYLASTLATLAIGALRAIPGLFTIVLIIVIARFLTRVITSFFQAVETDRLSLGWLHPDTLQPTRRIAIALLWLMAIAVAYPYLPGSESDVFRGLSIFAGLLITLGSTSVVGQAMSGLVLMYSRALKPGEYVRIGEVEGTVYEVGILATKIRTPKNELVVLPNAVVVGSSTKNFSRLDDVGLLWLHTTVTIGYDTPWRQVHALLCRAAENTDGLLKDPPPFVLQTALSDFYVEYQLNACLNQPETRIRTLAALHENIQDQFNDHGLQIMSPHFRMQPDAPVLVPREDWYRAPAVAPSSNPGE